MLRVVPFLLFGETETTLLTSTKVPGGSVVKKTTITVGGTTSVQNSWTNGPHSALTVGGMGGTAKIWF